MAADGNKKMNANLELKWREEMRSDVIKWIQSEKDIIKLFPRTITYSKKVELNPDKWNEGKLKKALPRLFRQELKNLANRMSDAMKQAEKSKSPKEHNKLITTVKNAISDTKKEIIEKCDQLLDDLETGAGDAKAGLALGKKAMAEVNKLDASKVFSEPLEIAMGTAKVIHMAETKGADMAAALDNAKKEIVVALKSLNETGKTAQSVAKYLASNGKKMADNPKGEVSAFGKKVMDKSVLGPLQVLDKNIDKLEAALVSYAKDLKDGKVDGHKAKMQASEFEKMKGLQKSADVAVAEMKKLQVAFKKVQKDLK
ncbi:hypothetical protein [Tateyamaria sp. Alg231-49]|uniref:hypothetical protein n=1 Tax=Tateyamaria sp. Alg231-49 TaxID=1922219 RepID=UPI000D5522D0|nr:hypothetical protein [Tateyamaria sp. Alg231-49]